MMVDRNCQQCGALFKAKPADVRRGWARFCSKSCKAIKQERRTGQHAAFLARQSGDDEVDEGSGEWDDHKAWVVES